MRSNLCRLAIGHDAPKFVALAGQVFVDRLLLTVQRFQRGLRLFDLFVERHTLAIGLRDRALHLRELRHGVRLLLEQRDVGR